MSHVRRVALCVLATIGATACSGGGGGGNGSVAPVGGGDSGGDSGSLAGEALPPINFLADVTTGNGGTSVTGASTDVLFDETFVPTIRVTGRGDIETFDVAPASSYDGFNVYTKGDVVLIANSAAKGLNYTGFGVWAEGDIEAALNNEVANVVNAAGYFGGAETSLPATGTATYAGSATAIEVQLDNNAQGLYTGSMTANVDFAARTISGSMDLTNAAQNASLTITTGDMGLNRNTGRFAGGNFSSSAGHTGFGEGRFFGPEQNEIGGEFTLTGGISTVVGGYGGARTD